MPPLAIRLAPGLLSGMLVTCLPALARQTDVCKNDGAFYTQHKYAVRKIIIETPLSGHLPLGFLFGLESRLHGYFDSIKPTLALKEGKLFSNTSYGLTTLQLAQLFGSLKPGERFRLAYPVAELLGCDDDVLILDVRYRVYTSDYVSFLSRAFESQPEKLTRALLPQALTETSKFLPAPFVGYNRSRGIFAGARLSINTQLGPIKRADLDVSGSSSSSTVQFGLIGNHKFKSSSFDHIEWRLAYRYFDLPADTVRHKGGALIAQTFVSTKPLAWHNLVLRFGSSLEGGHLQTDLSEPAIVPTDLLRTSYGALKMYAGGTMRFGRQSLKASYGLQLGQAGKDVGVDYVKQVFDSAYSVRFLPRDHMPLRLDTQFSAGLINSSSEQIPIAERFYGGNTQRNFIQGSDWQINSDVFLRSFPQNQLNQIGLLGPLGGKSFFSLNLTAAQTVWKRTLVPEELIRDPALYTDLRIKLRGTLENQRGGLGLSLLTETDNFPALVEKVDRIGDKLTTINAALNTPEITALTGSAFDLLGEANIQANAGLSLVADYHKSKDIGPIGELIKGFADQDVPATAEACADAIAALLPEITDPALRTQKDNLGKLAAELREMWTQAKGDYQAIRSQLLIKPEELKVARQHLAGANQSLKNIDGELKSIELAVDSQSGALAADRLDEFRLKLQLACRFTEQAIKDAALESNGNPENAGKGLSLLAEGYEVAAARLTGVVESVNDLGSLLVEAGLEQRRKNLADETAKLTKLRKEIKRVLAKIPYSRPQIQVAEAVDYTGHVFDVIFREMNLVAISPVVMLDVARLDPQMSPTYRGLRYGIGGGVRFSLVTFDITAAYSWNPDRRPGEGRGAFVFSMDISDLFR